MRFLSLLALLIAGQAQAADYYVVVWSSEPLLGQLRPRITHTFAAWVKVEDGKIVDKVEINWSKREVHTPIAHTIEETRAVKHYLRRWVLATDAIFFEATRAYKPAIRGYRMVSPRGRPHVTNCIHAVSDAAGPLKTGLHSGISAGQMVVDHFVAKQRGTLSTAYWVADAIEKGR